MMSPDLKWKQRAEVWLSTTALSTIAMGLTHSTLRMLECKSVCEYDSVCVCVCGLCLCGLNVCVVCACKSHAGLSESTFTSEPSCIFINKYHARVKHKGSPL